MSTSSTRMILCDIPKLQEDSEDPLRAVKRLSLLDAIIVSTTCPEMKAIVDTHLEQSWLSALGIFVHHPDDLLDLMDRSGSVVSGSLALWFLLERPEHWQSHDLDMYCPIDKAEILSSYLREAEGYTDSPIRDQRRKDYADNARKAVNPSISSVSHLINGDGRRIDIIESSSASALHPLPHFWTTLLPNYISARKFCVPYPLHVLHRYGCFTHASDIPKITNRAVRKYAARGFRVSEFREGVTKEVMDAYPQILGGCENNPYCPNTTRSFGDKWCLQYTFLGGPGEEPEAVDDLVPEWVYGGSICGSCGTQCDRQVNLVSRLR